MNTTIEITLNGDRCRVSASSCVADLLQELQPGQRIAIELNQEILPRSEYQQRQLQAGDTVEIVQAIGGG